MDSLTNNQMLILAGVVVTLLGFLYVSNNKTTTQSYNGQSASTAVNQQANQKPSTTVYNIYADWCGHSKNLIPVWQQLENNFINDSSIEIVKVEETQDPAIVQKYQVRGFPTILAIKNGQRIDYKGDRSLASLTEFANGLK
jgi:thiol-disulfide isomerase/thioredoxin